MPRRSLRMPDGESFSFDWDDARQGQLTKKKVRELYEASRVKPVDTTPKLPVRQEVVDDRYSFNKPLITAPAQYGQNLSDRETLKRYGDAEPNRFQAMLQGFGEGATEGIGNLASEMTAPLDIAANLLGLKGLKTGLSVAGRTLTGTRGLYNAVAGANIDEIDLNDLVAGREDSNRNWGQIGTGALEFGASLASPSAGKAARSVTEAIPQTASQKSPIRGALRTERLALPERTGQARFLAGPEGQIKDVFTDNYTPNQLMDIDPLNAPIPATAKDVTPPKKKKIPKVTKKDTAATDRAIGEFRKNVQTFITTAQNAGMPQNQINDIVKKRFPNFLKDESGSVSVDLLTGKWKGTPDIRSESYTGSHLKRIKDEDASLRFEDKDLIAKPRSPNLDPNKFDVKTGKPLGDIEPLNLLRNEKGSIPLTRKPPFGEPGSRERQAYMIWEKENLIADKRAKLEQLRNKDPKNINWGRDWEGDTRVRSIKDAENEIKMFEDRLAESRSPLDITGEKGSVKSDMFKALGEGAKKVGKDLVQDFTVWKPALKSGIPEIQDAVAQVITTRNPRAKPTEPTHLRSRSFKDDVVNPLAVSGTKELELLGDSGKEASRLMQRTRAEGSQEAGVRKEKLKRVIEKDLNLSKDEITNLADVAEGNAIPMNDRVKSAFKEYRAVMDETLKAAKDAGLKLRLPDGKRIPFEGRDDYWAHVFPLDMFKGKNRESLFNQLIEKGKTPSEARAIIDGAEEFGGRLIDPQHARTLDLPGYRKDIQSQYTYLEDMWRRITEARMLGPEDEKINALTAKTSNQQYASDIVGKQLGRIKSEHPALEHYVNKANTAEVLLKLPFFAISNMSQVAAPLMRSSIGDFAKGLKSTIFDHKDAKLRAEGTGALEAVYKMLYRDAAGEGMISKAYLMRPSEELNRTIASETGRYAADSAFNRLKKNPKDANARQELDSLLLEDIDSVIKQDSLTDKQIGIAGFRMSELTQGLTDPMDLPRAWNAHPVFKFPQLFRRFAFQQSKNIKNAIAAPPTFQGKLATMGKMLALYSVMGEAVGSTKAAANAALQGEDIEERVANRGENSFVKEIMSEITDDESLQFWSGRLADNLSNAFAWGLIGDVLDSSFGGKPSGFIEFIVGVAPNDAGKILYSMGESVRDRSPKPLIKTALGTSPFGRGISKRIYPD